MRISSLKTQHRIFVVGEALLEGEKPDRLALYLPDGTPVDLSADPDKMKWRGAWDADTTYPNESVVTFDSILWVAIQDVPVGITPGTDPAMWEEMVGEVENELPSGGANGYFLAKASAADGDVAWVNAASLIPPKELPPGGSSGYILAKASETDGDVYWIPAPSGGGGGSGLPPGGTYAMLLAKASSVDGDAVWIMPPLELPAGGSSGYILRKASSADGHVSWVAPSVGVPNELPPSGATGYILAKGSEETGDVIWIEPPSGGSGLPAGGTTAQVLAKNSNTDGDAGWVAPTPRDMPVGGSTGQVLTKNSTTDRDTGWATPSSGGGGSGVADSVYLDERFTTDNKGLYTLSGAGQALAWDSTLGGWIYPAAAGGGFYDRNDSHSDNLRNVLVAIEVQLGSAGGGTPLFSLIMRRQSDRFIMLQAANTSITVYTTSPSGGADVNRASTVAGLGAGGLQRGWLVASVYENTVIGWWGNVHPLQGALHASGGGGQARVVADLTGLAEFNTDANRTGRADRIRIGSGSSDITGHRIYRHLIIDLDKALPV